MAPIRMKPLPAISVDTFYFALMTDDKSDADKRIPGLVSVAFNPNPQNASFYADGGVYATAAQLGDLTLTVGLADIPPDIQAVWFGQPYEDGVLRGTQINPPDMAVGYRVKNSSGGYRYFWFLKGKASPPSTTVKHAGQLYQLPVWHDNDHLRDPGIL